MASKLDITQVIYAFTSVNKTDKKKNKWFLNAFRFCTHFLFAGIIALKLEKGKHVLNKTMCTLQTIFSAISIIGLKFHIKYVKAAIFTYRSGATVHGGVRLVACLWDGNQLAL